MILGGRPQHCRAANVDVLDGVLKRTVGLGHRFTKWVQVHDQEVNALDAVLLDRLHVLGCVTPCQQAAMDLGVQGFDAPIQNFR